jgi:hypothetical protein
MAGDSRGGATPWIVFLVGTLVLVVAIIAYVVHRSAGAFPEVPRTLAVHMTLPKAPSLPDAPRLPAAPRPAPR